MKNVPLSYFAAMILAISWSSPANGEALHILVKNGDPAPDEDGEYGGGAGVWFRAPVINNQGDVAFLAPLSGASTGSSVRNITIGSSDLPMTEVARRNTDLPGGLIGEYNHLETPVMAPGGLAVFHSTLRFTPGGNADNRALFAGDGSSTVVVARRGDPAPGGGVLGLFPFSTPAVNGAGQIAFATDLFDTAGGSGDNHAILRFDGQGQDMVRIARRGDPVPGGNGTLADIFAPPIMNEAGQVAFKADIEGSGSSFDAGIFRSDGTTIVRIVRAGNPRPGGDTFTHRVQHPALNDHGQVAFSQGGATTQGIYLGDGSKIMEIVEPGDALPGGNSLGRVSPAMDLNNAGQIAFTGTAPPQATSSSADAGIFRSDGSSTTQIALKNDLVPAGDVLFNMFTHFAINATGQVAFRAHLNFDPENVTSNEGTGIFLYDDETGLTEIARTGEPLLGSAINELELAATRVHGPNLPAGSSGLNDHGQVAFRFRLDDGRDGIALWDPSGSVTGVSIPVLSFDDSGMLTLEWTGPSTMAFVVEYSKDLLDPWHPSGTVPSYLGGNRWRWQDADWADFPRRFYRLAW